MASSPPAGQHHQPFADHSTTPMLSEGPPPTYLHVDSQPPSPNSISAAAILTALSDSRPPTSHGDPGQDDTDDQETGGVSLLPVEEGHDFSLSQPSPLYYLPFEPPNISEVMYASGGQEHLGVPFFHLNGGLDQHAAALEALTMEQAPASTFSLSVVDHFVAPTAGSNGVPDMLPSAYEEHLSIQDTTAFLDITSFFHYYANHPKTVPGLDMAVQPKVITRNDLDGDRCDFQGIDWSKRMPRASIRAKRIDHEKTRAPTRAWHSYSQVCFLFLTCCLEARGLKWSSEPRRWKECEDGSMRHARARGILLSSC